MGWEPVPGPSTAPHGCPELMLSAQALTNNTLQVLVTDGNRAGSDQAWGAEPHLLGDAVQVFPVQGSRQALS